MSLTLNVFLFDKLEQILGVVACPKFKLQAQAQGQLLKNCIFQVKFS